MVYEQKDSLQSKKLRGGVINGALDWWDVQILRKRVMTNSRIKQQQQQQQQQQINYKKIQVRFEKLNKKSQNRVK